MTHAPESYIESAERLCATLERIGDALVTLDAATLLETEETLSQLIAVLASSRATETAALEPVVRRGRDALLRCRRLGASYSSTARVRLQLCTGVGGYDREGDFSLPARPAASLRATA